MKELTGKTMLLLLLLLPAAVHAQFKYTTNSDNTITIARYTGVGEALSIPEALNGRPVTRIGDWAFYSRARLTCVTIPDRVTSIGNTAFNVCSNLASVTIGSGLTNIESWAFVNCAHLTGVYFKGNAPHLGRNVFDGDELVTIYHLPGTTGWGRTLGGRPTAIWISQTNAAPSAQAN